MQVDNKIQEFLQKLAPCIERGDLDACVEEAARELSSESGKSGRHDFAFENHTEHRVHREKWQLSVYSVVDCLCKYSLFQKKLKRSKTEFELPPNIFYDNSEDEKRVKLS
jgi:hypothetical protein